MPHKGAYFYLNVTFSPWLFSFLCTDLYWCGIDRHPYRHLCGVCAILWCNSIIWTYEQKHSCFFLHPMNSIHKYCEQHTLSCINMVKKLKKYPWSGSVCFHVAGLTEALNSNTSLCWMYVVPPTKCLPNPHSFH